MKIKPLQLILLSLILSTSVIISACSSGNNSTNQDIAPQGNWYNKQITVISDDMVYVTEISAYNNQIAISGINNEQSPALYVCNNNNLQCMDESITSLSPTLTKVTAIQYNESGNLYAIFSETTDNILFQSGVNSLFYTLSNNNWNNIQTLDGTYSSLQVLADNQIIAAGFRNVLYGQLDYGDVYASKIESTEITNYNSINLTAAVQDSLGNLFVAGQERTSTDEHAALFNVWLYQHQAESSEPHKFEILANLPVFTSLKGMVSDTNGNVYIAGGNTSYADHIWIYNAIANRAEDIHFNGYLVQQMIYAPQGYLFVVGLDNSYQPQVFWYNVSQQQWGTLNIPDEPENLTSITQDSVTGYLYIAGNNAQNVAQIWTFVPSN